MKQLFAGMALFALPLLSVLAKPVDYSHFEIEAKSSSNESFAHWKYAGNTRQQNLIGEVTSIDRSGGKLVIQTDSKTSLTVSFNDKTAFRRVLPGQTSLENAEQIAITNINVGDRVLIPGGVANEQTPIRQIVVMPRTAIDAQRDEEAEKRRARTLNGRITAVNSGNKEITMQTRSRGAVETITVAPAENVKFLRYAPDSLRISEAVTGSIADVRVGDFVRVVGDRAANGTRVNAEEVVFGTFTRMVGTISELNADRREVVIKNGQTGQSTTVAIGQNTTLRRISPDVARILKSRFEGDRRTGNQRSSDTANRRQQRQPNQQQSRNERQQNNQSPRQLFENLPVIAFSDLRKGDAVMIVASTSGSSQMTAVSLTTGDGELQQILLRTQGGSNDASNMSPGLPGNVSGGNAAGDDDEPQN